MAGVVPRDLGADATDELDKARQRVQRVRDWRWREETEEDILGFKKKAPPPRDTLDLSRNMAEVLVKGKFTSVGDTAMGVHERRGAAAEDRAISGRRLLQALCKLVLLADVFMQLLLAAWWACGSVERERGASRPSVVCRALLPFFRSVLHAALASQPWLSASNADKDRTSATRFPTRDMLVQRGR